MKSKHHNEAGLGLMELLISIAIMMFIAIGLAGAMGLGVDLFSRTDKLTVHKDELSHRIRLRMFLSNTIPPARLTTYKKDFIAKADRLSFYSLAETPYEPSAVASKISIFVEDDVLKFVLTTIDANNTEITKSSHTLTSEVRDISFSYYGEVDERTAWHRTWDQQHKLPKLVRITTQNDTKPSWPEFTVKLSIGSIDQ